REYLHARLPGYMVPSSFGVLAQLPLTPSGKVDRKGLAKRRPERPEEGSGRAPRTPSEELVAGIFAEVLRVERVGLSEDFFALGGHSLLATQVASRVRRVFGVELPVRSVFERPTVEALAGWLELSARDAPAESSPLERVSREEPLVLSFAQQRLWFLDRFEPGSPLYTIPVAVDLTGRIERGVLGSSLGEVVRRHEVLRTSFGELSGAPYAVVAAPAGFTLPLIDLAGLSERGHIEERRLLAEQARRPFDLGVGPLLRGVLFRSGSERHGLLLTMHHIASDGWSMGVLVRELGALYSAWQRRHLSGGLLESELGWWRGQLGGLPGALDLPLDHPRPSILGVRGSEHDFAIGEEDSSGLGGLCRRHGATLFMTLLAGFAGLLQRTTGEEEVALGTPIAGRTREETECLIGLFVNTLILRTDLTGNPSFAELLVRVRETTLSAYGHQELPFERLVEDLSPERDLSRPPLVQVLFTLQNAPLGGLQLPGLRLSVSGVSTETSKFEISCALTEGERGLSGRLEYNRDLFDPATIVRLADRFVRLLSGAVSEPERRLSELSLLSAEEREQLTQWNDTGVAMAPPWMGLHELFATQAVCRPEALAVTDGERELTYGELDRLAGRLSGALRRAGTRTESRVALCMERSVDQIVGVLAVLKAGGAFVVLDPTQPLLRLRQILSDVAPAVVLTHSAAEAVILPVWGGPVVRVEEANGEEPAASEAPGWLTVPEQLAYVVYTSGSTGTPKGILISQGSVVNLSTALEVAVYGALGPDLRVSLNAPLYFDGAIKQLIQLLRGRTLCVVPESVRPDPAALAAFLAQQRVDVLDSTPAQLLELVEIGWGEGDRRTPERVLVGGEAVGQALWDRLRTIERTQFFNVYGPSECTVDASVQKVTARMERPMIGSPLANVQVHVTDRWGGKQPPGIPGELCVGGLGLARGYLGRPDLTAERFVPDPFAVGGEEGSRLYRTGDLARWLPEGNLEFLGRIDQQVKLRGFRIELGEIEAVLSGHPALREVAVVLTEADRERQDRHLVAWVVGASESVPSAEALREYLHARLPGYMVPSSFGVLAQLPLTPSGKVDRKGLAKRRPERPEEG